MRIFVCADLKPGENYKHESGDYLICRAAFNKLRTEADLVSAQYVFAPPMPAKLVSVFGNPIYEVDSKIEALNLINSSVAERLVNSFCDTWFERAKESLAECKRDYRYFLREYPNSDFSSIMTPEESARFEEVVKSILNIWRLADCGLYEESRELKRDICNHRYYEAAMREAARRKRKNNAEKINNSEV